MKSCITESTQHKPSVHQRCNGSSQCLEITWIEDKYVRKCCKAAHCHKRLVFYTFASITPTYRHKRQIFTTTSDWKEATAILPPQAIRPWNAAPATQKQQSPAAVLKKSLAAVKMNVKMNVFTATSDWGILPPQAKYEPNIWRPDANRAANGILFHHFLNAQSAALGLSAADLPGNTLRQTWFNLQHHTRSAQTQNDTHFVSLCDIACHSLTIHTSLCQSSSDVKISIPRYPEPWGIFASPIATMRRQGHRVGHDSHQLAGLYQR